MMSNKFFLFLLEQGTLANKGTINTHWDRIELSMELNIVRYMLHVDAEPKFYYLRDDPYEEHFKYIVFYYDEQDAPVVMELLDQYIQALYPTYTDVVIERKLTPWLTFRLTHLTQPSVSVDLLRNQFGLLCTLYQHRQEDVDLMEDGFQVFLAMVGKTWAETRPRILERRSSEKAYSVMTELWIVAGEWLSLFKQVKPHEPIFFSCFISPLFKVPIIYLRSTVYPEKHYVNHHNITRSPFLWVYEWLFPEEAEPLKRLHGLSMVLHSIAADLLAQHPRFEIDRLTIGDPRPGMVRILTKSQERVGFTLETPAYKEYVIPLTDNDPFLDIWKNWP